MRETGLRFHASRGSMSVGESLGGLPPDSLVENEASILKDSQRVVETFHDNTRHAMTRVTLAPCSPFSVSRELMRDTATLARSYAGVRLHTHLAENQADVDYSLAQFGLSPGDYAESLGWLGDDVWHAHCVCLSDEAILKFGRTRTGVAHCPCSNLRLASGLAPIRRMRAAGVPVGLGADGAASNDATNLLHEAREACLVARVLDRDAAAMSARDALEIATLGGAAVLGRDDIGSLAPGMSADFICIDIDTPVDGRRAAGPGGRTRAVPGRLGGLQLHSRPPRRRRRSDHHARSASRRGTREPSLRRAVRLTRVPVSETETANLPVIDLSPALGEYSSQGRAVARSLHEALHETGFMYVVGHDLDAELLARAFRSASRFFSRPLAEKKSVAYTDLPARTSGSRASKGNGSIRSMRPISRKRSPCATRSRAPLTPVAGRTKRFAAMRSSCSPPGSRLPTRC